MNISLVKVEYNQKSVLRNLLEFYQYDFSEYHPEDVNEHGLYEYKYLDHYWTEEGRFPFLIQVDGQWAGFALIRRTELDDSGNKLFWMAEFFVMKKYRRMGVGQKVAEDLFTMFPGTWRVGQMESNTPAQLFWRKIITKFTNNNYQEVTIKDWDGPVQQFTSGMRH